MLRLKNEFLSIEVDEKNPLYRTLSKLDGEVFFVSVTKEEKEEKLAEEPKPTVQPSFYTEPVRINIAGYLSKLDFLYPEKSTTKAILKNHALMFLGVSESTKSGVYAALSPISHERLVTCVRTTDRGTHYLAVDRKLVEIE